MGLLLQHNFNVDWSSIPISATTLFCSICEISKENVEMNYKSCAIKQKLYSTIKNKKLRSKPGPIFL